MACAWRGVRVGLLASLPWLAAAATKCCTLVLTLLGHAVVLDVLFWRGPLVVWRFPASLGSFPGSLGSCGLYNKPRARFVLSAFLSCPLVSMEREAALPRLILVCPPCMAALSAGLYGLGPGSVRCMSLALQGVYCPLELSPRDR